MEDLELQALVLVLRSEVTASLQVERHAPAQRHLDLDLPQLRDDLLRTPVLASRQGSFSSGQLSRSTRLESSQSGQSCSMTAKFSL